MPVLSQRKIEANRRNAAKSTGPRTVEGKAVASPNATTHGLTATSPVALDESQEEFDAFASALRADLRPRGALQQVLVDRIVHLSWKLRRLPAIEAEKIRRLTHGSSSPQTTAAAIATDGWDTFGRLQTYESRIERSLHACLKELASIRKLQAEDPAWQNEPTAGEEGERMEDEGGRMNAEATAQNEATPDVQDQVPASVEHAADASVQNEATAPARDDAPDDRLTGHEPREGRPDSARGSVVAAVPGRRFCEKPAAGTAATT